MARVGITQYSTTPGDNTDVNGVNLAEGCPPSGINNAIRQLMADIATLIGGGIATIAQIFTGTSNNTILTPKNAADSAAWVTLTDASTIALDGNTGFNFTVTLGGNRTLGAPANLKEGQPLTVEFVQDATGGRALTWNAAFDFSGSTAPTLSTAPGAKDYYSGIVRKLSPLSIVGSVGIKAAG